MILTKHSCSHGHPLLFSSSYDCAISILSYLSFESISCLDIAVANSEERLIWLKILRVSNFYVVNEYEHCHASIRWLVSRDVNPGGLKIRDSNRAKINCSTLLGLNTSSLRQISFRHCMVGAENILSMTSGCAHLREICLHGCNGVTDLSIRALAENSPELISLDVGECDEITDNGLIAVADAHSNITTIKAAGRLYFSNLKIVNFSRCFRITDIGILAFVQNCRHLSEIDISYCRNITDIGVSAIAQHCSLLRNINLHRCKKITDISVAAMGQHCPNLMVLDISGCRMITDIGVSALAQHSSLLTDINVSYCEEVTDIGLSALGQYCPNMKKMNTSNNRNITYSSLVTVAVRCSQLSHLNISGCTSLTHNCLHNLRSGRRHIDIEYAY